MVRKGRGRVEATAGHGHRHAGLAGGCGTKNPYSGGAQISLA